MPDHSGPGADSARICHQTATPPDPPRPFGGGAVRRVLDTNRSPPVHSGPDLQTRSRASRMSEPRPGTQPGAAGPRPWGPSPVIGGAPRDPAPRRRPPPGTGRAARVAADDAGQPRSLTEVKRLLAERARAGRSPFQGLPAGAV